MPRPDRLQGLPIDRVILWTGLLATFELLVLRLLTRTFIHIPGLEKLERPLSVVFETGRLAFYATVVAVVITLVLLGLLAYRHQEGPRRWLVVLPVGGFLLAATVARMGASSRAAAWVAVGCILVLAVAAPTTRRLMVGAFYASATLALAATNGLQGGSRGLAPGQVEALSVAGEILLVLAGMSTLLLVRRRMSRPVVLVALGAGLVTYLLLTFARSAVLILTLWAFGLAGHLPILAYAAAVAAVTATVITTSRTEPAVAGGVLLLMSAGAGMTSTYQSALGIAGLAALYYLGGATGTNPTHPPVEVEVRSGITGET